MDAKKIFEKNTRSWTENALKGDLRKVKQNVSDRMHGHFRRRFQKIVQFLIWGKMADEESETTSLRKINQKILDRIRSNCRRRYKKQ